MNISEETIDSFLRGDLTGAELENFNKTLSSDPKLQQEVSFQQDIVDSIKQYRHNQLKNRLNSIEVPPISAGSTASIYFKLAASIGIVALLIGSFALFTNTTETDSVTNEAETPLATESLSINTETAIPSNNTPAEQKTAVNNTSDKKNTAAVTNTNAVSATKSDVKKSTEHTSSNTNQNTQALVPGDEEMENEDMSFDSRADNFSAPTMNHTDHSSISASVVKVNIVKEKNLAYRYFNNELYLHGNFSNSTYELFELNNKPSKQLFLYFENNYYELIQGKTKITDLVPITDKATLLQLAQLREH